MNLLAAALPELEPTQIDRLLQQLTDMGVSAGKHILAAVALFVVGRFVVRLLNRLVARMLARTQVDKSVQTFLRSLVNILLTVLLVISIIGALGVSTTSFAALLASAGVAVGMALSGNLQNFAGVLVILLFKHYKVGDWVEAQGYQGQVREIQIFHTIIMTSDLRLVYIPNGAMSTAVVVNYNQHGIRREIWTVSIEYGNDVERARRLLTDCMKAEPLILAEPKDKSGAPLEPYFVKLNGLNSSSVDLSVRAYVKAEDYWPVHHKMLEVFYAAIDADPELNIPFNTQTLRILRDDAGGKKKEGGEENVGQSLPQMK
ncbi:MAG: mechanosensitive ion channel [Alloprevotella sp.]|nr:mechanosensitive ion channel [Alloprevotella sp.]